MRERGVLGLEGLTEDQKSRDTHGSVSQLEVWGPLPNDSHVVVHHSRPHGLEPHRAADALHSPGSGLCSQASSFRSHTANA